MKVFDASSIFVAIKTGQSHLLKDSYSVILARYELGNIIWKETALSGIYSIDEGVQLVRVFDRILEEMKLLHPPLEQVYKTALKYKMTYYDASYLFAAEDLDIPLITEDKKMRQKAESALRIYSLAEII
jgi:predicted nucleic acid-binding protein